MAAFKNILTGKIFPGQWEHDARGRHLTFQGKLPSPLNFGYTPQCT